MEVFSMVVLALANFFGVKKIVFCQDGGEGFDLGVAVSVFEEGNTVAAADQADVLEWIATGGVGAEERIMVACPDLDLEDPNLRRKENFNSRIHWVVGGSSVSPAAGNLLPLRLDSNMYVVRSDGEDAAAIEDWYKVSDGPTAFRTAFGVWTRAGGLSVPRPFVHDRRSDLGGVTIRNAVIERGWEPLSEAYNDEDGLPVMKGMLGTVLTSLQPSLNFTTELVFQEDRNYGWQLPNGTWVGLVATVAADLADVSTGALTVTSVRQEICDFSIGLIVDRTTIITRDPAFYGSRTKVDMMSYLSVFSKQVWGCVFAVLVVFASLHAVQATLDAGDDEDDVGLTLAKLCWELFKGLINCMNALMQLEWSFAGALPAEKYPASARIFVLTVNASAFVLFAYYCADFTAVLTSGPPDPYIRSFQTMQDVVDRDLVVAVMRGTSSTELFETAPSHSPMSKVKFEEVDWYEMMRLVEETDEYVAFDSYLSTFSGARLLPVMDLQDSVPSHIGFALQKDSELTGFLNYHLLKLVQHGLLAQLTHELLEGDRPADRSIRIFVEDSVALGYDSFFFPGSVLAAGLALGATLACAERGGNLRKALAACAGRGRRLTRRLMEKI